MCESMDDTDIGYWINPEFLQKKALKLFWFLQNFQCWILLLLLGINDIINMAYITTLDPTTQKNLNRNLMGMKQSLDTIFSKKFSFFYKQIIKFSSNSIKIYKKLQKTTVT